MSLSHRHRQIVELLINRKDDMTAGEIATEIHVSTRTVHRELSELEMFLTASGLTLQKKSGKGIQLQGSPEQLEAFKRKLHDSIDVDYSADERKLFILCMLVDNDEPIKLFTLSHGLRVTIPTVTHDLDELEHWIHRIELILVRKRGYGVGLSGTESNKRKLLSQLARTYLDDTDLFGKASASQSPVTLKLLELIGKPYFTKVEAALWQAEEEGLNAFTEKEYTHLLINISIALARIAHGKLIELRADNSSLQKSTRLTGMLKHLCKAIPSLATTAEIAHIADLLEPKEAVSHPNQLLPIEELGYLEVAWSLIRNMETRSGIPYSEDHSLRDGLHKHLQSTLQKLKSGVHIRNPLLLQIKKDYESLFEVIRTVVDETIMELAVPDEEIGYLVMHFGASMERQRQFSRNVRAVLVCTSGIGTSKMLAVRLTKELPQINIIGHASWFEAVRISQQEYDLIISTVDLPLDEDQYIKLSPLLNKEEVERLRSFIQNVTLQRELDLGAQEEGAPEEQGLSLKQHRIQRYVNAIVRIVDSFAVYGLEQQFGNLEEALLAICTIVRQTDSIDEAEPIVRLLLARERQSSQIILDTGLALFHIRSELVRLPSVTLFRLKQDLPWEQPDASGVRHLLLMLGPKELSKESLEVLSEISSYLLMPEMIQLLKYGSLDEIKPFLSQELAVFLDNKK